MRAMSAWLLEDNEDDLLETEEALDMLDR